MPVYAALNSFNAGELSPKMIARTDVAQYHKGCRTLRNFIITPYGAAERRPGTRYIAAAHDSSRVRLIPFVVSSTAAYVCEFADHHIRFFRGDAPLAAEISSSPYAAGELADLQYVQSADVMTIVHPAHPVMELRRTSETSFQLVEKEFEYPPVLDPNLDDEHTVTPSAMTGDITLSASKDTFSADNVGGFFQLVHTRQTNEIRRDFTGNGVSASIKVHGYWTFTTHGTWTGNVTIQRSFDNGISWSDYRTYSSSNDSNTSTSGEEDDDDVLYRIQMEDYSGSSTGTLKLCRCLLVNPDYVTTGVVRITAVSDAKHASGTVLRPLGGTAATHEWNEGAWSARRGFPRSIAFYEERMFFGGTAHRPQTVWGSKTGDWDNFQTGDKDDDGLDFTLASDTINVIGWMCQHEALVIGTADSEWTLSASDTASALTPSNFHIRRQSVYGSSATPAQMVGDTILFVQRGARKVREFVFNWEKQGYSSPDLTILAEHISESGIGATALQRLPDTILWCVLADGTIAALTYERDQEVIGWHKHETNGAFRGVCVIPDGAADRVYFVIERARGLCIERLADRAYDAIEDAFFVDCGVTVRSQTPMSSVSGLWHLDGQEVQILADGAVQLPKVVSGGSISLDSPASVVSVGLGFCSLISPMPAEIETPNGSSMLRIKAIAELRIRAAASVGGEVRVGEGAWEELPARDVLLDNMDRAITSKDEALCVFPQGGFFRESVIQIRQKHPLPLNINSIVAVYDVCER